MQDFVRAGDGAVKRKAPPRPVILSLRRRNAVCAEHGRQEPCVQVERGIVREVVYFCYCAAAGVVNQWWARYGE